MQRHPLVVRFRHLHPLCETIKRKASPEEPAHLITQEDGDRVLKSHSELEKLS